MKLLEITRQTWANITRTKRYNPEIKWSSSSWTHNVFRFYELLFGKKWGCTVEFSFDVYVDENGKQIVHREFYTWESLIAHVEGLIRQGFPAYKDARFYVPAFASIVAFLCLDFKTAFLPIPFLCAVAYDATASTFYSTTSVNLTITGSNVVLIGGSACRGDNNSAMSYNGSAMSVRSSVIDTDCAKLWSHTSPATGTNPLAVTISGTNYRFGGISVTGADTTLGTDVTAKSPANLQNFSVTITAPSGGMAVDIMCGGNGSSNQPLAGGSGGANTLRWGASSASIDAGGMSSAPGTGSSMTMTWDQRASSVYGQVAVPISPLGGAAYVPKYLSA